MDVLKLTAGVRRFGLACALLGAGYLILAPHSAPTPTVTREPLAVAEPAATAAASAPAPRSERADALARPAAGRAATRNLQELGLGQLALARELLASGESQSAVEAYQTAMELYPSTETHAALGGLYFKLAARSLAYVEFRKAVELDPYNADLWIDLANAEHLRTAIGESWYAIKKARELEPGIQIVQTDHGFYERAESDPGFHTSRGSYTQRRIP